MTRCPRCGLRLTAGRCPADLPELPRCTDPDPRYYGREYGTVQQLVHRLGADVTVGMVRQWRKRKGLGNHDGLSFLDEAQTIEGDIRRRKDRRGRPRRVDVGAAVAA
ncbi:hypothetical protein ACGFI9_37280 [Micromonospora sp. NPDC048930]|uniref:hypothetical protein n=1 Tax=Micromonospora sp. NPDC048930 TaxID=3364261 RepID=UPI00371BC8C7